MEAGGKHHPKCHAGIYIVKCLHQLAVILSGVAACFLSSSLYAAQLGERTNGGTTARRNCAAYLASIYDEEGRDPFDTNVVVRTQVGIAFHGSNRLAGAFGGHQFEVLTYYVDTIIDGQATDRSNLQSVYCVTDDDSIVLGMEDNMR
jgi:hypothetical protein